MTIELPDREPTRRGTEDRDSRLGRTCRPFVHNSGIMLDWICIAFVLLVLLLYCTHFDATRGTRERLLLVNIPWRDTGFAYVIDPELEYVRSRARVPHLYSHKACALGQACFWPRFSFPATSLACTYAPPPLSIHLSGIRAPRRVVVANLYTILCE